MGDDAPSSEELSGRAPWLRPADLDADQRRLYDSILGGPRAGGLSLLALTDNDGRLRGPFNAMLFTPQLGEALQALGVAVRYTTDFSGRAREIAILEVGRLRRSEFEWFAHVTYGRAAGLTDAEIDALRTGAPLDLEPTEAIVREVSISLVESHGLDDDLFARAQAELGHDRLNQLVALVGYYEFVTLSLQVWQVPLPPGQAPAFGP